MKHGTFWQLALVDVDFAEYALVVVDLPQRYHHNKTYHTNDQERRAAAHPTKNQHGLQEVMEQMQ